MAFSKILVANRGEIACRVQRTARALGYASVAVFSDADADALHVALADEAVRIGPPPAAESYLNMERLLQAAGQSGADAVHPGYGFLSENGDFAEACERAGLAFIGPPAATIRAMGNKGAAKRLMIRAGVPCVPGYLGEDQSDARLQGEAQHIGFPVMIKAAAGGGGRGMRLVSHAADMPQALSGARSEAKNAFGSDELILEKALVHARHIEIQVFGDNHGHVLHLGERDCSIQRRHQKVIEEAPSPAVTPDLRERMGAIAAAAARAIGYRGAGTVEFLLDAAGAFYFLEMNTRLQVEHAVTEAITGLDLVEWQLRVAAGEALPLEQAQVAFSGHAMEARLCAEDPHLDFLPSGGTVAAWEPVSAAGVRIDHGLRTGHVVSPYYDSLLAKVIAHGRNREEARRRLLAALGEVAILGIATNRTFLLSALQHPEFVSGNADTGFIARNYAQGSPAMRRPAPDAVRVALAAVLLFEGANAAHQSERPAWRSTGSPAWPMRLEVEGQAHAGTLSFLGASRYSARFVEQTIELEIVERHENRVRFSIGGLQRNARYVCVDGTLHLDLAGVTTAFRDILRERRQAKDRDGDASLLAPMNGRIVAVLAKAGDAVAKGQRIVVLEAMKMQHEIAAGRAGIIESIAVREGEQVATRQLLAALAAEAEKP